VNVIKGIAGIAAVVFVLCPISTGTQILAFAASVVVFLICHFMLVNLDETYLDKYPSGYWPPQPMDWTAPLKQPLRIEKRSDGRREN